MEALGLIELEHNACGNRMRGPSTRQVAKCLFWKVKGNSPAQIFSDIHPMMWILTVLIIANQTGFIADLFG